MVFLLSWLQAPRLLSGPSFEPSQKFHRAQLIFRSNLSSEALSTYVEGCIASNRIPFTNAGYDPSKRRFRLLRFSNTLQFLSVLTISIDESEDSDRHKTASLVIESASAACLPAWVPLVFLFQWLLFWLPFPDFGHNLTLCKDLAMALETAQASGGVLASRPRFELKEPRVLEAGCGRSLTQCPPVLALAAVVSPQSRFFLVFIALPGVVLISTVLRSGIVKFS